MTREGDPDRRIKPGTPFEELPKTECAQYVVLIKKSLKGGTK